jgi:Ca2+-binding EF-hand superfamily protein
LLKFSNDIGLGNELFLRDLNYYFPQLEKGEGVSFQELLQFLDFTTAPIKQAESLEAFKCFDRNGVGQIHASDLLTVLKKCLTPKIYELYAQLITSSYGPLINYMDLFGRPKKFK